MRECVLLLIVHQTTDIGYNLEYFQVTKILAWSKGKTWKKKSLSPSKTQWNLNYANIDECDVTTTQLRPRMRKTTVEIKMSRIPWWTSYSSPYLQPQWHPLKRDWKRLKKSSWRSSMTMCLGEVEVWNKDVIKFKVEVGRITQVSCCLITFIKYSNVEVSFKDPNIKCNATQL